MSKLTLSASGINIYKECFNKYYFRYIKKIKVKEIKWPGTIFGTVIHAVLEDYLKGDNREKKFLLKRKNLKEYSKNVFNLNYAKEMAGIELTKNLEYRENRDYNHDTFFKNGIKYAALLINFFQNYFPEEILFAAEQEIQCNLDDTDIDLKGLIDVTATHPGVDYRIYDLKSTKISSKFYYVDWKKDIQSLIYCYLQYQVYGSWPESFGYLVIDTTNKMIMLKENKVGFEFGEKNILNGYLYNIVKEIKERGANPKDEYVTPEKQKCYWCPYGKGICQVRPKPNFR